ncbi:hypothetical protein [Helicobacter pametensis]|uniref:hypothetical protein n=1 Tax=Helicobacter pametensis TaxID=95149 RepID=UPI000487E25F|nr:hypothetical protein [Helicobacter pametensis]
MRKLMCLVLCFGSLISSEIALAFKQGKAKAHVGTFAYIDFLGDSTFWDLGASFSYQSGNFYGYKFLASAWFNPPLYEVNRGFRDNKTWFEITELGINFFNSRLNLGFDAGRFAYRADWVDNYVQGLSFFHTYSPFISYGITWINQSALVENYQMTGFRRSDNWLGGVLIDGQFKIPNTIIELEPYIYSVANMFWAPAIRTKATFEFLKFNSDLIWEGTLLSYVAYHNREFRGSGILFWSDLIYRDRLRNFDAGGGIMATNRNGVKDLAVFGQSTQFENIDGMLDGGSTSLYAFGKFHFKYDISLKIASRLTFVGENNLFGLEARAGYFPIKKLELGLDFLMLAGYKTQNKQDHYAMRAFLQYHF